MGVFYILTSAWKKNHKMCIWNWFFAMCSADWTCVNGSRIQLVLYANCFLGLTYGFFNKNFQEIKLFICHCSNTIVRLQVVRFLEKLQTGYSPFLYYVFLYMFHWIAIHFLIHYLPFNIFAVCCSFSINCFLSTAEAAYEWSLFSVVCLRLYSLSETVSLSEI